MQIDRRRLLGGTVVVGAALAASRLAEARVSGDVDPGVGEAVKAYAAQHLAEWGLPGMTIALSGPEGAGVVCVGLADVAAGTAVEPRHLFQVGSITKMMAGLAFWSLVDEGKAVPAARLADVMPELAISGGEAITIQHLLNHTSGLPGAAPLILDGGHWVGFPPGTSWEYCNLGYRILGKVIERIDRRPFPDAVEARVLAPLGMAASKGAMRSVDRSFYAVGYQPTLLDRPSLRPCPLAPAPWVDYDAASGCVASTPGDMATFLGFLALLGRGDGGKVLSPASAAAFLSTGSAANKDMTYANGVMRIRAGGRDYLHHTGGMVGFSSSLHVDPEAGVGAFASANIHYARSYRPRDVTRFACELMRARATGGKDPSRPTARPYTADPGRFVGAFSSRGGETLVIEADGDMLAVVAGGARHQVQPVGDAAFATDHPRFAVAGLDFEVSDDKATRVWVGGEEYLRNPADGFKAPFEGHEAFVGHYATDDRWGLDTRVYARGAQLHLKSGNFSRDLVRDGAGWRFVDGAPTAARIVFDGEIEGRRHRVVGSGEASYRVSG